MFVIFSSVLQKYKRIVCEGNSWGDLLLNSTVIELFILIISQSSMYIIGQNLIDCRFQRLVRMSGTFMSKGFSHEY